jgi:hypothetical protein
MSRTTPISLDKTPPAAAVRIAMGVRRALHRAGDRLLPPEVLAWEKVTSMQTTNVIGALVEVGAIDSLGRRPAGSAELAAELDLDADTLGRVMRQGAGDGLLRRRRDGTYELTALGEAYRSEHSPTISHWARYMNTEAVQRAWAALPETIRTGEPSFPAVHGRSVWQHFAANPDEERLFANSMRELTDLVKAWAVNGYPWPEVGTICDVAGGSGPLLAAILEARPGLRGMLVEAPGVLPEADAHLTKAGVRDRVELIEGNIFERIDAAADVYTLKDILHDWDDERSLQILRTVRAAMAPGAMVVLVETLIEDDEDDPIAARVDLHMLTQCDGGRQRSVAELQSLLSRAGFRPGGVHRTGGPAMIEGIA